MSVRKTVIVDPAAILDEAVWTLYESPPILKFVEDIRERYDTGPDVGVPPDHIKAEIFKEFYAFLARNFFDEAFVNEAVEKGGFLTASNIPGFGHIDLVGDMANCLGRFAVLREMTPMRTADLIDAQIASISEMVRPKRGRSKAQEMRAFIRDGISRGLDDKEMALEWWDQHPDEYPGVTDAVALQRVTWRMKKKRNSP